LERQARPGTPARTTKRSTVTYDHVAFSAWKTKCINLTDALLSTETRLSKYLQFGGVETNAASVEFAIGQLIGLQDVLTQDLLSDFGMKIEAEIASDYMGQAEALLGERVRGTYSHVPAAVLVGAVLEKTLRTLCGSQIPPISLVDGKGNPKMLNSLIDDLKKADVYKETKAKQLRAWAAIRNDAAHGEPEKFRKAEVEAMVKGIGEFLADYLR
jgi:hypothetical protein